MPAATLTSPARNLSLMTFPLKFLGVDMKRNVSLIRLESGKLIVHSTAPFAAEDVAVVKSLGEPAWLVDTLLRHDTFAKESRAAFPEARYLAPPGFSEIAGVPTESLLNPPVEWAEEIAVAAIDGAPEFGEIVVLHRPSRTLIVADLIIHFHPPQGLWTRMLLGVGAVGGKFDPGVTKPFKKAIKDAAAFENSIRNILAWDFDRVIVGHGTPIQNGGKAALRQTLEAAGVFHG